MKRLTEYYVITEQMAKQGSRFDEGKTFRKYRDAEKYIRKLKKSQTIGSWTGIAVKRTIKGKTYYGLLDKFYC